MIIRACACFQMNQAMDIRLYLESFKNWQMRPWKVCSDPSRFKGGMNIVGYLTENIVISEDNELTPEDVCEMPIPYLRQFH